MTPAHQRGLILYAQGRHDLAAREFRADLAQRPDDPTAHALLSLCLAQSDRVDDAIAEADEAVRCGPDLSLAHFARGSALRRKGRKDEARRSALEAARLDPDDADCRALLATLALDRRDWRGALAEADHGLELDAEHLSCRNIRAMALTQLGRKAEAEAALGSALADDPDDALTHANQGWTLLHRGEPERALDHFREALRLDPDLEWGRLGIVEALKARRRVYRWMLAFFLWMGRKGAVAQWAVVLGIFFGRQALAELARSAPGLAPIIEPVLILSFGFILMTWVASPLFNATLRFNKFGRMALSREQARESTWIGGLFGLAAVFFAAYMATGNGLAMLAMGYFGLLIFPVSLAFKMEPGRRRRMAAAYATALALIGLSVPYLLFYGPKGPRGFNTTWTAPMQWFLLGSVASTWIAGFVGRGAIGR